VNKLVWLALVMGSLACNKNSIDPVVDKEKPGNGYTEFLIPTGQHSATGNGLRVVKKAAMRFEVLFDSSCIYRNVIPENIYDINKLYGFSDCGSTHHQNSARVGWLWNGTAIELHAYCYVSGVRTSQLMGTLQPGRATQISISVQPKQYVFEWNGKKTVMNRSCESDKMEGYQLYPYFGGDETAPHDIRVFIKDIE
jgi:hypothetical protein